MVTPLCIFFTIPVCICATRQRVWKKLQGGRGGLSPEPPKKSHSHNGVVVSKGICQFGKNPFAIANLAYTSWLQQSLIFKLSTWSLLEYFICSSSIALLSKQKVWCKIFLMPAVFLSDLIRLALTRFGGTLYLDIPRPHPNIGHDIWHNTECFFNWSSIVKSCFKYGHWGRGIGASLNSYIFTQYL